MVTTQNEYKRCRVIRKGDTKETAVAFCDIQEGDTIFVNNTPLIVTCEAHYSGDATYDGYLLYAEDDEGYFPDDVDEADDTAERILL